MRLLPDSPVDPALKPGSVPRKFHSSALVFFPLFQRKPRSEGVGIREESERTGRNRWPGTLSRVC